MVVWFHLLFLPAAGVRNDLWIGDIEINGRHWSTTAYNDDASYWLGLRDTYLAASRYWADRKCAYNVRLASVVSEVLTEDVSSVPSCCGESIFGRCFKPWDKRPLLAFSWG